MTVCLSANSIFGFSILLNRPVQDQRIFVQLSDVKLTLNTSASTSANICFIHYSVTLHL